ncbi:UvrB/UvrC motif-containing protein [Syntrophomonas erecta]
MMYCEECKQKPANVHLAQVFNGKKVETHLCEECAAKKGILMFNMGSNFSIPNLLGSFLGHNFNLQGVKAPAETTRCPHCGMNFMDITQTGKLGCAECYTAFEQELEPTLRRIHGNSQHVGKIPARGGEKVLLKKQVDSLKIQLQQAVACEEYERAAEIRDSIKELEKELD